MAKHLQPAMLWICFALLGCATPAVYGPIGPSAFGYRDWQNSDGSHTILVIAPNAALAHEFWDRRAAELCGGPDFHKNIFRAEIPVTTATGYAVNAYNPSYGASYTTDVYGAPRLEGYLRCNAPPVEELAQEDASSETGQPVNTEAASEPPP